MCPRLVFRMICDVKSDHSVLCGRSSENIGLAVFLTVQCMYICNSVCFCWRTAGIKSIIVFDICSFLLHVVLL